MISFFSNYCNQSTLIPSYRGFQKWTILLAFNQRMADISSMRHLGLGQGAQHPSVESADITNFVNMPMMIKKTSLKQQSTAMDTQSTCLFW